MKQLTREEKISEIYEKMTNYSELFDLVEDKLNIGDVLHWMEDKFSEQVKVKLDMMGKAKENMYRFREKHSDMMIQTMIQNDNIRHNYNLKHFEILLDNWKEKHKPIDDQPDETVNFIHSLLEQWKK